MNNISVRVCDLPCSLGGFVVRTFDSGDIFYTIILNSRYSAERQRETYEHELCHIEQGDFDKMVDPDIVEYMRH